MKMMSVNSNKRKGRLNPNSNKIGKSKFYPPEKNMLCDGIYGNSKLMYTAASLVGCVVQIQVQNGAIFEGVLRTFSHQLDIVLEMAHRVNSKSPPSKGISPTVSNLVASYPFDGGIFDKLIFKLSDIILMVATTVDMDYAVKDTFTDTAISKFNGQVKERELEPWEDVASDPEGTSIGFSIEDDEGTNGWDANDMFRTNAEKYGVKSSYDNSLQDYTVPLTKKDTEEYKIQEAKALKIAHEIENTNAYQSRIQLENGDEEDRFSAVVRTEDTVPSKYVLPQKRRNASAPRRQQHNPASLPMSSSNSPRVYSASTTLPNQYSSLPVLEEPASLPVVSTGCPNVPKMGAALKSPAGNVVPDVPLVNEIGTPSLECPNVPEVPSSKHVPMSMYSTQTLPPRIERRRENEKKFSKHKGRTDEIEEFKKFSTNFKLTEDVHEVSEPAEEALESQMERTHIEDTSATSNVVKFSTLNPNAKEFVFNPNAKAFTPRSMSVVTPPVQPPPPPVQEHQGPMAPPPAQMLPPQHLFTTMAAPQYHVMQATPVSVAITSPFATATPVPQPPPRFRKSQPLLAPPTPSQLTVQYTSAPPGILHASATHAQPTLSGYPQMNFVVGPRVVSPQPVGVTHSVSYCDTSHLPTHLIMSAHPGASTTSHTLHQTGGQHSNHHPPQCQTPVLHPSPSPVHQVPPPPHSQSHTPTAIMYPGGTHHHLHQTATSHPSQPVMHHGAFPTGPPQPFLLMQQPGQPGHHPSHLHMHPFHHSQAAHGAMLPQMTIIPTSAAMTSANTPPYMQHP